MVKKNDIDDIEGCTIAKLMNVFWFSSYLLGCMANNYKWHQDERWHPVLEKKGWSC